ncbi:MULTISPECIES: nSTAND1 domain-containing NTPase [unclassified Corallococcus]|uniref:nSTAND1 domain-containing NTPase n=1 Tax=unclassified Corallococcus TaxID=2685029 RepID=UPI001A8E5B0F|nr:MULTISPECIES: CHAT domain-containing protein [unclassified Corallococcus]MBN9685188.1 CHAT domain-containing protein [Corallococcus sp. NCSPR001]WAS83353.1 CHAT domain-containing protein [Corallococcus sp. NCRR]
MKGFTTQEPVELLLDFVRTEKGDDAHAFRFEPQDYLLRKDKGAVSRVSFSWDSETMKDLESLQGQVPAPNAESRLGNKLRSLLGGEEARIEAALTERRSVRLTIRSNAAELYALPWELLRLSGQGIPLYAYPEITLRYTWPGTSTAAPVPASRLEGGRILFAWSEAGGDVAWELHLDALQGAARAGHLPFDPVKDVLPAVSLKRLADKLEQARAESRPYAVLHVLCHGKEIPGESKAFGLRWDGSSLLVLEDIVSANRLRDRLYKYAAELRLVVLCVCQSGNMGEPGSHLGSVAHELHRASFEAVVASRFPLSVPGSVTLTRTLYGRMLEGLTSLEDGFVAAREALNDAALPTLDHVAIQLYGRPEDGWNTRPFIVRPYQGLRAFQPEHARFFFGRATERDALLKRVLEARAGQLPRLQVLAAASGTGKSSLVLAGVVPELVRMGWRWKVLRPSELSQEAASFEATPGEGPLLVVVDQFEEIFTRTSSPSERDAIVQKIGTLAQLPEVVVLCTLRVDFLGRCGEVTVEDGGRRLDHVVYDEAHRMFLSTLDDARMAEVITGPAWLVGLEFEEGLVEVLRRDIAGESGALPLLEYALDRLWEQRKGRLLTHEAYQSIGGVEGAVSGTADRLMAGFSEEERAQVRRLFVAMVGIRQQGALDTRRRVWMDDARPAEPEARAAFERVVEALVASRLVVKGMDTASQQGAWLEVAHEALLRKWPLLREWVAQDEKLIEQRHELEVMTEGWERSRGDADGGASYLLRGNRLRQAAELRKQVGLGDRMLRFIEASEEFARNRLSPLDDLEEQGWGIVVPEGARGDRLLELIRELVDHRERIQRRPVQVFRAPPGLDATEAIRWKQGVYQSPGISPRDRPNYLLILGDLNEVSLDVQQELAGELMIGRLAFRKDEHYSAYAAKVVRWEKDLPATPSSRLLFLSVRDGTPSMEITFSALADPCQEEVRKEMVKGLFPEVHLETMAGPELKDELLYWGSMRTPSVVVSTTYSLTEPSHGWSSPEEQRQYQGTLIIGGPVGGALSAAEVAGQVFLPGGVWLMLAGHSAGTPGNDRYGPILEGSRLNRRQFSTHAEVPFVAALPQALLSNPDGPLAVIGWVSMGMTSVFFDLTKEKRKLSRFLELLRVVCRGSRVGTAMARFYRDIPALTTEAFTLFEQEQAMSSLNWDQLDGQHRALIQVERHSLRDIILLGDPAARLPIMSQTLSSRSDAR